MGAPKTRPRSEEMMHSAGTHFRRTLGLIVVLAVITAAVDAQAQVQAENTAAACQDRVDNDGDGYVDCQDQDCGAIVTCARAPGVVPLPGLFPPRVREPTGRGMATAGCIGLSAFENSKAALASLRRPRSKKAMPRLALAFQLSWFSSRDRS